MEFLGRAGYGVRWQSVGQWSHAATALWIQPESSSLQLQSLLCSSPKAKAVSRFACHRSPKMLPTWWQTLKGSTRIGDVFVVKASSTVSGFDLKSSCSCGLLYPWDGTLIVSSKMAGEDSCAPLPPIIRSHSQFSGNWPNSRGSIGIAK